MIKRFWIDSKQPLGFHRSLQNAYDMAVEKNLGDHQGDVLIELESGKLILIEVKEVPNDFIASITDKRLFRQADGMKEVTPWCFLLLSGEFHYDNQWRVMGMTSNGYGPMGEWSRAHIDGALTSVQARGLIVRTAYKGYVDAIRLIINWVDNADRGEITSEPIKLSPFDKDDQKLVNLLAWYDGIGVTQAKNFIEWCKNQGITNRLEVFLRATQPFDGSTKPNGWTLHTVQRCATQLGTIAPTNTPSTRGSWLEELDQT